MIRRLAFWIADYAYVLRSWARAARKGSKPWPAPAAGRPDAVGVLLLPGIYESWRFLEPLALRLLAAGYTVHVAPLGLNRAPVRASADRVRAALAGLPAGPLVIVAHSKGGLIGKQLMLDTASAEPVQPGAPGSGEAREPTAGVPEIRGMVAINTPFDGSAYARYFPLAAVRALSPAAQRALANERAVDRQIVAVRASWDPHIPGSRELPDATNVTVPAMGHFRILADVHTQDVVLGAVDELEQRDPPR